MKKEHPNIAIIKKFNPANVATSAAILAQDAVWHYINPELPDIEGDYIGLKGFQVFFEKLGNRSNGTFKVNPISATPLGDELVVVHVINTMFYEDRSIEFDAVIVWRIVDGKITEGRDIPAVNTVREVSNDSK